MRAGDDRFEIGERVFGALFPDGVGTPYGLSVGQTLDTITAALGPATRPGNPALWSVPVGDQHGRRIEVSVHTTQLRAGSIITRFYSTERLDIDSAYRLVREHLEKKHGPPGKEVGQVLAMVWKHPPNPFQAVTKISRFKDANQENVLQVLHQLPDGERLA